MAEFARRPVICNRQKGYCTHRYTATLSCVVHLAPKTENCNKTSCVYYHCIVVKTYYKTTAFLFRGHLCQGGDWSDVGIQPRTPYLHDGQKKAFLGVVPHRQRPPPPPPPPLLAVAPQRGADDDPIQCLNCSGNNLLSTSLGRLINANALKERSSIKCDLLGSNRMSCCSSHG